MLLMSSPSACARNTIACWLATPKVTPIAIDPAAATKEHIERVSCLTGGRQIKDSMDAHDDMRSVDVFSQHKGSVDDVFDDDDARLAWIQFTSGTTGVPKAVSCTHKSANSYAVARIALEKITTHSVIFNISAVTFDPFQGDTYTHLIAKCTLAVPRDRQITLDRLGDAMCDVKATHVTATPGIANLLQISCDAPWTRNLRVMALGGEAIPTSVRASWTRARDEARLRQFAFPHLVAVYGCTEATVYQTSLTLVDCESDEAGDDLDPRCVGYAMPGHASIFLRKVDDDDDDDTYEVCLSGACICSYYMMDSSTSSGGFIDDARHGLSYRTGDLGMFDNRGRLVLRGRLDEQMKVRGVRLEPREVEASFEELACVAQCVALAVRTTGDDDTAEYDPKKLVAVVVDADDGNNNEMTKKKLASPCAALWYALERHADTSLRPEARPHAYLVAKVLPVTANGKVDRRAIADAASAWTTRQPGLPKEHAPALVRVISSVWQRTLGLPMSEAPFPANVDFARLGGDSLTALRAALWLRVELGYERDEAPPEVLSAFGAAKLMEHSTMQSYVSHVAASLSALPDAWRVHPPADPLGEEAVSANGITDAMAWAKQENIPSGDTMSDASALLSAAGEGRKHLVEALLRLGADVDGDASAPDDDSRSTQRLAPLHAAAAAGHIECVRALLAAGAKSTSTSATSATPLHVAAARGQASVVRLLLAPIARSDDSSPTTPACARDRNKQTIVHMAARSGDAETLDICLRAFREHAKPSSSALDRWRRSPLHWAVLAGSLAAVRLLLAPVPDDVALRPDADGTKVPVQKVTAKTTQMPETPLELAIRLGHLEIASALLDAGAGNGYSGSALARAREMLRKEETCIS